MNLMYKPKIYLSGGFRSNWQKRVIDALGNSCTFFNPREHNLNNAQEYWTWDIHFVRECDIVFAYMEADNPSGYGLMLEVGLAYGLNKTIILVDEKSKFDEDFSKYFKIVSSTANVYFEDIDKGVEYLMMFGSKDGSITT